MAFRKLLFSRINFPKTDSGFTFVGLMVLTALVGFFAMAAHPLWQNVIRRAKEEELVFRGIQYADAIARFKRQFARAPLTLEELYENKCIRKLYKDPMTEDGEWDIVYSFGGRGKRRGPGGAESYAFQSDIDKEEEGFGSDFDDDFFDDGDGDEEDDFGDDAGDDAGKGGARNDGMGGFGGGSLGGAVQGKGRRGGAGAIVGVRCVLNEESLRTWDGKTRYNEWLFVAGKVREQNAPIGLASNTILPGRAAQPGAGQQQGGPSGGPPLSFPEGSSRSGTFDSDSQGSKGPGPGADKGKTPPSSGSGGSKGGSRPGSGSKGDDNRKGNLF
jgi:type II secretory pathway pseudopilin PulG